MNHSTGISDSYYRVTGSQLLEDYLNAVTISNYIFRKSINFENNEIKYRNDILERDKDEVILLRKELQPLLAIKKTLEEQGLLKVS